MITPWSYHSLAHKIISCFLQRKLSHITMLLVFGFILYNEYFVYYIKSYSWPNMNCGDLKKLHSILVVADPQILGEKSEHWYARWDNDRYLKQTFSAALRHVNPELILFLGDLMDEGSLATDEEYQRYFLRFKDIFYLNDIPKNKTLFIPGDNDIGGEYEMVTDSKANRFKKHFNSPSFYSLGNIKIIQVDKMQRFIPQVSPHLLIDNHTRIAVTHMPLLGIPSAFAAEVLEKLRPNIILSAHDHTSMHFSGDIETGERMLVESMDCNKLTDHFVSTWRFQRSDSIVNEVVVPTCSYRMGVPHMGFGVALLDRRGEAWCYHVLWLPSRFLVLKSYFVPVILIIGLLIKNLRHCLLRLCYKREKLAMRTNLC